MSQKQIDERKIEFSSWCATHSHSILTSFPKSGRNYLGSMIRRSTRKNVVNGIPGEEKELDFSDVFLFVLHRERWEIRGEKGKYILLIRDPRDAILSRTYTEAARRGSKAASVLEDEVWMTTNILDWQTYFDKFLPYQPHVVQYEELCLFPVETLTGIFNHLGFEYVGGEPFVKLLTWVKQDDRVKVDPLKETDFDKREFATGFERYQSHCLKWKRDPNITEGYERQIWRFLGSTMERYGYLEDGHSDAHFSQAYSREISKVVNF